MRQFLALLVCCFCVTACLAEDRIYAPLTVDVVKTRVMDWTASQGVTDKGRLEAVASLWALNNEQPAPDELHERAMQSFVMLNADVKKIADKSQRSLLSVSDDEWKSLDKLDPFVRSNLRAGWMKQAVQSGFLDEALQLTQNVEPALLIDPASYFFFKAVGEQRLLMKKEGLATLKLLRHSTANVPVRYSTLAELMEKDLEALEEKSLNEVARLMSDVERRLGKAHGGDRVQKVEDDVIKRLDDIIKKLEDEAKKKAGQGQGSGQAQGQQKPAEDSRVKGSTAPGEVDKRDIGHKSGWGALPPKEQAKAKNLIDRELPPHYRNAIEQYLKKLATRPESSSGK